VRQGGRAGRPGCLDHARPYRRQGFAALPPASCNRSALGSRARRPLTATLVLMVEEDDWPGARWRGATWVEYFGGPWDGTMLQIKSIPLQYLGKITAWPRGTTTETMNDGSAAPLGEYHPVAWADEELQVVKLEWRKAGTSR
jgi:hypothetical protein